MIFVTGGTGFLGRHLVPGLCRAGYRLRLLIRNVDAHPWLRHYPDIEVVTGDLYNPSVIARGIEGCRYVIHAGGLFRFWGKEADFEVTNVQGTEYVMDAALKAGVERIIHVSTVALIGNPDPEAVVDETDPPHPADSYQESKLKAETVVKRFISDHQLPVIILRPGAYYGPLGTYAFNRLFFRDALRGLIVILDGGKYITFPVFIEDVVQGILKALERGRLGETYNLAGDWLTHNEVFDIICEEANLRYPRLRLPGKFVILLSRMLTALSTITRREPFYPINLQSVIFNNWRVSSEKAKRELGFEPTDFRTGARRTLAWYQANQPAWLPELDCAPQDIV